MEPFMYPTHGQSRTRTYNIWAMMRQRCTNPNAANYARYGARGITVCERWHAFANFYADMGDPPTPQHTLDRIDLNGNYTPQNCRWADVETQQNNRSNGVLIHAFGQAMSAPQWARKTGLTVDMITHRIRVLHMHPEQALTTPRMSHRKRPLVRTRRDGTDAQCYDSLATAARALDTGNFEATKKAIWNALAGRSRTAAGFCWAYAAPAASTCTSTLRETS